MAKLNVRDKVIDMKRFRLLALVISMLVLTGLALTCAGCSDSDSKTGETEATTASGLMGNDVPPTESEPPVEEITLADVLCDTWVDENGVYMYFSDGCLVDYLGVRYTIGEAQDDGVYLTLVDNYYLNGSILGYTPIVKTFFVPIKYDGEELVIAGNHLVSVSSEKGQQYVDGVYKDFVNTSFSDYVYFTQETTPAISTFKDNGTYVFEIGEGEDKSVTSLSWEYEDGFVTYFLDSNYNPKPAALRRINDHSFTLVADSGIDYLTTGEICLIEGDYFVYDFYSGETYRATINGNSCTGTDKENAPAELLDLQIEYSDRSLRANVETENYGLSGDYYCMQALSSDCSFFFFPGDSILAELMRNFEAVTEGSAANIFVKDHYETESDGISVNVDFEILSWDVFVPSVAFNPEITDGDFHTYSEFVDVVGPVTYIYPIATDMDITYEIPKDRFESADSIGVTMSDSYYTIGKSLISKTKYTVTETADSYIITFANGINSYDNWYGIVNLNVKAMRSCSSVCTVDPYASVWGNAHETRDVLDLVNLEYIAGSIVDENGSADFWVSTPAELASATYYINELDVFTDDTSTYFYIHLLNDIDLAGFTWAPIGQTLTDNHSPFFRYRHSMNGVIFGNGYAIRNLSIDETYDPFFIGSCENVTIVGLTLDGMVVNESANLGPDSSSALVGNANGVVEIYDSRLVTAEAVGESAGGYNWVQRYYMSADGTYDYDVASEYENYLEAPWAFDNGTYYYDNGSDTPVSYVNENCAGFLYNGWLMTNYGVATEVG